MTQLAHADAQVLVGREEELAAIDALLEGGRHGPAALLLEGEPGIGKTTLWHVGVDRARKADLLVLNADPGESETKLAYAALADLLAPAIDAIGVLPEPQRRALRVALRIQDVDGAPPDATAVALAALNLVRRLADDKPVLVAIDDMQWLDTASAEVVTFLVKRLREERVAVLVSIRSDADVLVEGLLRALADSVERVVLSGLDAAELRRLIGSKLGVSFPPPVVERIQDASGGNPFFALEIARVLERQGKPVNAAEPLPVPGSLQKLIHARIGRVSPGAQHALLVLAAASSAREGNLAAVAVADENAAVALEEAAVAELLVRRGDEIRFTHPLLRSAVYERASAAERARVHRNLADTAVDPEERARHLALATATPDGDVAKALHEAARTARERGALTAAAELAEHAIRLTPPVDHDSLWLRYATASEQHYMSGNFAAARPLIEASLATASPGEQRALSLYGLGILDTTEKNAVSGVATYREALSETGVSDKWRAEIATSLAHALSITEPIENAVATAREAAALAGRCDDPALLSKALARVALFETLRGTEIDEGLMARALDLEDEHIAAGAPAWARTASIHFAEQLIELGDFERARAILEDVCARCRDAGVQMLAWPLGKLAALEVRAGNWIAALARGEEAVEFAEEVGDTGANYCHALKAYAHAARGEAEAARAELAAARRATEPDPDPPFAERAAGFVALCFEDYREAHEQLLSANERCLTPAELAASLPDQIEASAGLGAVERAAEELAELERLAATLNRPLALATACRCRGIVAAARGDIAAAETAFTEALAHHAQVTHPFEEARTSLGQGTMLRRAKRARRARDALTQAERLFAETGASVWAERAKTELARLGGRPAQTHTLTATERQVAELVSAGRTNAEVARALHVSPKTVEWNLSKVYRKLRVGSRTELAAKLTPRS